MKVENGSYRTQTMSHSKGDYIFMLFKLCKNYTHISTQIFSPNHIHTQQFSSLVIATKQV